MVGGRLFTEAAFRAHNDDLFADATRYPDAAIAAARDAVTEQLEGWTGQGWVVRYCRIQLPGTGARQLYLNDGSPRMSTGAFLHRPGRMRNIQTVIAATVSGTSVTPSNVVSVCEASRITTVTG